MLNNETNGEHVRSHLASRAFLERYGRSNVFRSAVALGLILFGALLFLSNLGLFPIGVVWDYWPLVIIAFGVVRGFGRPSLRGIIWAVFLIVSGTVVLLLNLGVLHIRSHDDSWPLSLVVIALGVLLLVKAIEGKPTGNFFRQRVAAAIRVAPVTGLKDWAIFGSVKRRLETPDFEGGEAISVFGSVEIDLRRAQILNIERPVFVDCIAIFGAIKLRVPENWRVNMQGTGLLGNYEDKTITANMPGFQSSVLVVSGVSIFASVEIEN